MKTIDVVHHFKTKTAVAKALNCWHTTISSWGEYPPYGRQCEIEILTKGALKAEPCKKSDTDEPTKRSA